MKYIHTDSLDRLDIVTIKDVTGSLAKGPENDT